MSAEVHNAVDRLLLEQGEYSPLEYLLSEGRLLYSDYERWRGGELGYLDEALFGDPLQALRCLRQAGAYLQRLGWQVEAVSYTPWHGEPSPARPGVLRFSADSALHRLFHQCYHKPQDRPQLDLFTDNPATSLANGVIQSLADRDAGGARRQLDQLGDIAPDYPRLGELERLTEAMEALKAPVDDPGAELRYLQETLMPLADTLLGNASNALLIPLWRRLSGALVGQAYCPAAPQRHLSYTAMQALDWAVVRESVEKEPGWRDHPVLLQRHARTCELQGERCVALQSWFCLCWKFPDSAAALRSSGDAELRWQWWAFEELDAELPTPDFPAWLLLRLPGLTRLMPDPDNQVAADTAIIPDSYRTLYCLCRSRTPADPVSARDDIALRARLRSENPLLLQCFLETR
ncbi:MAG: hypothetical protein KDI16_00720 [Halioglobus sp.]|nr:hypothetical protein [Halioglobus sp.]